MSMRSAVIAATPMLVSVPLPVSAPSAPVACHDVHGTIEAGVDRVSPTLTGLRFEGTGTSQGDFEGAVAVRAIKRPGARAIRLRLLIATRAGQVEVSGATVLSSSTEPDVRAIQGTWMVAGQTGEARGASGSVTGTGTADTQARSARIEYQGRICKESQAVDANPKGARHVAGKQLAAADHHVTE